MHGFGSHTYSLVNAAGERTWVKFHWVCQQGIKNLTDEEAAELVGKDRESHQRDLYEAIENGDFPKLEALRPAHARGRRGRPTSSTRSTSPRSGSRATTRCIEVGVMELNRNPENYFADVEQAAFNPANVVPGIGFSPDKMLQGRLFSYGDAQRYRLGVNHHQIPVNAPRCPMHGFSRDGAMRVDGNYGSTPHYEPNSNGTWQEQPEYAEPPLALDGAADRYDYRADDDDYYTQPGLLFGLMDAAQREALFAQHRPRHGRRLRGGQDAPHRQLPQGRPGLRRGRGRGARHPDEQGGRLTALGAGCARAPGPHAHPGPSDRGPAPLLGRHCLSAHWRCIRLTG